MSSKSPQYATEYHTPVLVAEVLEYLTVTSGGRYIDGTLGGGGHTEAILAASAPDGKVLGIDRDPEALTEARARLNTNLGQEEAESRATLVLGNYSEAARIAQESGFGSADGFLVDAGVSSHQLDSPERGFSFQKDGPLDMRMGEQGQTVAQYLAEVSHSDLSRVLRTFGDIRSPTRVATAILEAQAADKLHTTADLRAVVESVVGHGGGSGRRTTIHPATLVFQALRIAVNRELEHLQAAVEAIPDVVRPGGRAVFISFHSLEDRIIKHGFRSLLDPCTCPSGLPVCICGATARVEILTSKPVMATDAELALNPRARSARLRAVKVL